MANKRRWHWVLVWHRRIGLTALIFIAATAATGLVLNHVAFLDLDRDIVTAPWIVAWYGETPEEPPISFKVDGDWVTSLAGHLYLNGAPVADDAGEIHGAVSAAAEIIAVGTARELFLFTADGGLIERVSGPPGALEAIGRDSTGLVVARTAQGLFRADADILSWQPAESATEWSSAAEPPAPILDAVFASYRGRGIPMGRLILDIHTGRIFGRFGPYVMDAAALCLIVLAITGVVNWVRGWRRQ